MTTALALWVLAVLDGAFAAQRAAAGRTGRIDRRALYARVMAVGGAVGGLLAGGLLAGAAVVAPRLAPGDAEALRAAGDGALRVLVPYAALVGVGFVGRLAPSVDVVTLTSVVGFGPLTLLRRGVLAAAAASAVLAAPRPVVAAAVAGAALAAEGVARGVDRWLDRPGGLDHPRGAEGTPRG